MELCELTVGELNKLLISSQISISEILNSVLKRIEEKEKFIQAYITLVTESALKQAKEREGQIKEKEKIDFLFGMPIALKDNFCTKDIRTTCASRILENFVPPYDAAVVSKLSDNTIFLGKTNMDEFAMGSSTENSAFGPTKNPWDINRVPGGSSGGSAAAVAAGEAIAALGSDTGGSIRQPASFCGVVGMKPTYGRVSRFGLVAFASSLDQIGPITKDVTDCAIMMNYISGFDISDSTSANVPVPDFVSALKVDIKGIKIGVPIELLGKGIESGVAECIKKAIDIFGNLGAVCEEVSLPHLEYSLPTYYILAPAEASSNLARYDGVQYGYRIPKSVNLIGMYRKTRSEGFGNEVKRRIMLGTYALSAGYYDAYYLKAQKVRTLIKEDFDKAFSKYDVLITPTSPTVAFKIGEKVDDPLQMYLSDICTIPINLAGIPAISIPCGFVDGLPVGMQILGKPFDEETVLRIAYSYEQQTDWHKRRPEFYGNQQV